MKPTKNKITRDGIETVEQIIESEAMDWFSEIIEENWDSNTRTFDSDPPSLIEAFKAGWMARERYDAIEEE